MKTPTDSATGGDSTTEPSRRDSDERACDFHVTRSRRGLLATFGSAILASVAGCASTPDESGGTTTTSTTGTANATTATTVTTTETTATGTTATDTTTTDTTTTTTETTTQQRPRTTTTVIQGVTLLTARFGVQSLELSHDFVRPGQVRLEAVNSTMERHRITVVKTDLDPAMLPRTDDGRVDERQMQLLYDQSLPSATSRVVTFDLEPGQYVFFCDEPNHYSYGEFAALTVE